MKVTDKTWFYDTTNKIWTEGPSFSDPRYNHACMVDQKTSTIHIMGGLDRNDNILYSTQTVKYTNKMWEISSGSNLPVALRWFAASPSRSNGIIGYLIGGYVGEYRKEKRITSKIWALRRRDKKFVEIKKRLQIRRAGHTSVNVHSIDIPGC